jgi:hypothetical protein
VAIQPFIDYLDCFASLAMTNLAAMTLPQEGGQVLGGWHKHHKMSRNSSSGR